MSQITQDERWGVSRRAGGHVSLRRKKTKFNTVKNFLAYFPRAPLGNAASNIINAKIYLFVQATHENQPSSQSFRNLADRNSQKQHHQIFTFLS